MKGGLDRGLQMVGKVEGRVDRSMDVQLVLAIHVGLCPDVEGMHQGRYLNWVSAEQ